MATATADLPATTVRRPTLVLEPTRGWRSLGLAELWRHRELAVFLAWRRVKVQYRQMAFGPLWAVFQPALNMIIFTFVFGTLAKLPSDGVPYPLFTFAALLPWTFFATSGTNATGSLLDNLGVISKIYFPRMLLPVAAVLSSLVDLAVGTALLLVLLPFFGYWPHLTLLALPIFALLALLAALALGLWTAAATVWFRDVKYGVTFLLQAWMFATPVAYAAGLVPAKWRLLYELNPLYWVVQGYRWSILGTGQAPALAMLPSVALVLAGVVAGAYVFRRTERSVVDVS